jgi:DNA repair protein RadC
MIQTMSDGFSDAAGWSGFAPDPAFASTGPHGHRGRMRDRLLDRGAAGLADYEILEMLFFFGIARRDTKPLAKAVMNHFGSLAVALTAPPAALLSVPGVTQQCVDAIALVQAASRRLADAEARETRILNDWPPLRAYLREAAPVAARLVLYLDSKNRLLEAEAQQAETQDAAAVRQILKRALDVHATALLLVSARAEAATGDADFLARLRQAGGAVSVGVHDHVLWDGAEIFSLTKNRFML